MDPARTLRKIESLNEKYSLATKKIFAADRQKLLGLARHKKWDVDTSASTPEVRALILGRVRSIRDRLMDEYSAERQLPELPAMTAAEVNAAIAEYFPVNTLQSMDGQCLSARAVAKFARRYLPDGPYPYWVKWSAVVEDSDGERHTIQRNKFVNIKNNTIRLVYANGLWNAIIDYGTMRELGENLCLISVTLDIERRMNAAAVERVANADAENCVINILRLKCGDGVAERIYKTFGEVLMPEHPNGKVYINARTLDRIAKLTRRCIVTYTTLGLHTGIPWQMFGWKDRGQIHIHISQEHATLIPKHLSISEIKYYDKIDTVPNAVNVVGKEFTKSGEVKYYVTQEGDKNIIHKIFHPSTITGNAADDNNLAYSYATNMLSVATRMFRKHYGLTHIRDQNIKEIVKKSEHFIGRRMLEKVTEGCVAFDQNKNYRAFFKSVFYIGFPSHKLVASRVATSPAFYICRFDPPKSLRYFYGYDGVEQIVIAAPVYNYLSSIGTAIDVDYVLNAEFSDISIEKFADSLSTLSPDDRKLFCNSLIGATIAGGVGEGVEKVCYYIGQVERQQLIFEAQRGGWDFEDDGISIKVKVPANTKGLFHFHSYILAYAAIHMMEKWDELESAGHRVIGYNVDCLVAKVSGDYDVGSKVNIGGWKAGGVGSIYSAISVSDELPPQLKLELPEITIVDRPVYSKNTVINGPAGIGKSRPFVSEPTGSQMVLTPTHDLKNAHLDNNPDTSVLTAHKLFQFALSDAEWMQLKIRKQIPPAADVVVVDEYTMYSVSQWEIMRRRAADSIIVALGDDKQIVNAIAASPVKVDDFRRWGFDIVELERTPDMQCRHSYEYGSLLDGFRIRNKWEQMKYLIQHWDPVKFSPAAVNVVEDRVVVGNHVSANKYNSSMRDYLTENVGPDALFPFRTIARPPVVVALPVSTAGVFWDRKSMEAKPPKGSKYEPYFAVTADSMQGKTVEADTVYVDYKSLTRDGTLYSAMTRTKTKDKTVPVYFGSAAVPKEVVPVQTTPIGDINVFIRETTNFKDANTHRVDLGNAGNRALYFRDWYHFTQSYFVKDMMTATQWFNLNEYPSNCNQWTRLWFDIDIKMPLETVKKLAAYIDKILPCGDHKILMSGEGKVHCVLNTLMTLPLQVGSIGRDAVVNWEWELNYDEKYRKYVLGYFRDDILQNADLGISADEWNEGFDLGAKGLRAAYSVKVKSGEVVKTTYYAPLELLGRDLSIDEKVAAVHDCSIYKPATGQIPCEIYEEMQQYYMDAREEEEIRALVRNELVDKYEIEFGTTLTFVRDCKKVTVDQQFIDTEIEKLPKSFKTAGNLWKTLIRNIKIITAGTHYDSAHLLHTWSAGVHNYDALGNESYWKISVPTGSGDKCRALAWLLKFTQPL